MMLRDGLWDLPETPDCRSFSLEDGRGYNGRDILCLNVSERVELLVPCSHGWGEGRGEAFLQLVNGHMVHSSK